MKSRLSTALALAALLLETVASYAFNPKAQELADRLYPAIVEDFALSNVSYAPAVEALSARIVEKGGTEAELRFIRSMIGVSVENFESTLDLIDAQYGSLSDYLEKALGFTARDQKILRDKLLFESPDR